ncbi:hypothetical protein [Sulfurospirillum barnesii]|uniref:Uncharacterized protein n=1 Tax=Sulfurospirillum barnesii (strain ATCC 700032 / DSM 10660 / SES-3) TaxID=760154 RepID=I3Y0B4_SULBS|nr:hypothetical protein [Sulfurospirillum barnesii]AFL69638.1 hypothetical protein Sulba_2370 [Sulfurospirillum barnesii SES-3]
MNLTPEIIMLLMLDGLFLFFGTLAFVLSLRIFIAWDRNATTKNQYQLEKNAYLVGIVVKYILMLKVPLFLFFIYTCDTLSSIITGAMCAAGVVNSVDFGLFLLLFKLLNLYLFGFWLLLHSNDVRSEVQPYMRAKSFFFCGIFFVLVAEIVLEILFFTSLDISKIVSCCGTLFSATEHTSFSFLFAMDERVVVAIFYASFTLMVVGFFLRNGAVYLFSNLLFLLFGIVSLIVFFSTYVYELPTHHCPFCLLQKEYYGVGYGMYTSLFLGTFYGIGGVLMAHISAKPAVKIMRLSLLFNGIYLLLVSAYPLVYFLKNGVWL